MKPKHWILLKIAVYTSLIFALLMAMFVMYIVISDPNMSKSDWGFILLIMLVPAVQLSFQLLNTWLLHQALPGNLLPGNAFKVCHTILLVAVALCIFLYCGAFIEGFVDMQKSKFTDSASTRLWQQLVLGAVVINILASTRSITGSLKLRNYLLLHYKATEDQLLNSIGNDETHR